MPAADATSRFSDRVEYYVRSRPGYPEGVIEFARQTAGLVAPGVVGDIGAGTGITSAPFLRRGDTVFAVEPNDAMRAAAERLLAGYPRFHSVAATAEATTLPDESVNLIVVGQAFHWFDHEAARREFVRILKPPGWTAVLWNTRRRDGTPFARAYETLLESFGIDYLAVRHENIPPAEMAAFFDPGTWEVRSEPNIQQLDLIGFQGRLASSSYLPGDGHPRQEEMCEAAERLFVEHQRDGFVAVEYDCELHLGRLTDRGPC